MVIQRTSPAYEGSLPPRWRAMTYFTPFTRLSPVRGPTSSAGVDEHHIPAFEDVLDGRIVERETVGARVACLPILVEVRVLSQRSVAEDERRDIRVVVH